MKYDVIVIGLGAAGAAALWQLARRGAHVIGVDRFAPPHTLGSTHGETRITRLAIGEGPEYTPLALRSHAIWRDIEAEAGVKLLTPCGGLIISNERRRAISHGVENFFSNTVEAARRHAIAHEILDAPAIRRRFPRFRVADHEVGYYEPEAGFLAVEDCVRTQLALAEKGGAHIETGRAVTTLTASPGGVRATLADGDVVEAEYALVTAGGWTPELLGGAFPDLLSVTRQVLHWFEVDAEARADFEPGAFPVYIWELPRGEQGIYGFPIAGAIADGVKIATEQSRVATTPDCVDRNVTPQETDGMFSAYVAPFFSGLRAKSLKTATCFYTDAPGGRFVIDRAPGMPRTLFASACSGHGFKHSAALGEALAERLATGRSTIDLSPFSLSALRAQDALMDGRQRAALAALLRA